VYDSVTFLTDKFNPLRGAVASVAVRNYANAAQRMYEQFKSLNRRRNSRSQMESRAACAERNKLLGVDSKEINRS
jgi:hypothetical protein